ncbi:DUF3618 domain-containing protein [Streptomyces sp. NPDC003023]|uniref:DUF3618 domain-containing protein n=1 Tax=Streptomyces sp. NPDC003023 TaxID=3364675 RepID=UPI00367A2F7E
MSNPSHSSNTEPGAPSPAELRAQVEETREDLGRTVEALAAKADVRSRAKQTAADAREQAVVKAAEAKEQLAATAATVGDRLREKTPPSVQDTAHQATEKARGNPKLVAGAAVALLLLMLVKRRRRR